MVLPPDTVLFRSDWERALAREYDDVAARLLKAYQRTLPPMREAAGELSDKLRLLAADRTITRADLKGLTTYQRMLLRTETELNDFATILRNEAIGLQEGAIPLGSEAALDLAANSTGELSVAVRGAWNRPDPAALQRLINYIDGAEMRSRFANFGENAAQSLADLLLTGVAQGKNPVAIAGMMDKWFSIPYAWAENTARTVQIWSYRLASHASYAANPDIVTGWVWSAALDTRTCISCISQHGTEYPVTEILNDHHRGRCTPLPIVRGTTWARDMLSGPDWFENQPVAVQLGMMGPGIHKEWMAGRADWPDFSRPYQDGVYGEMLRRVTLGELKGM